MHKLIAKYVNAYQTGSGDATAKVKKILMSYSHTWDWSNAESLVSDLIDDANITAEDIVAFLADTYEMESDNEEFRYAVRAMQICLRKAELAEIANHEMIKEESFDDEIFGIESDLYMPHNTDILQTMQY